MITCEADYRQYLQRRGAIQKEIEKLRAEKENLSKSLWSYVNSPTWLKDRTLDPDDPNVTTVFALEMTNNLSVGCPDTPHTQPTIKNDHE